MDSAPPSTALIGHHLEQRKQPTTVRFSIERQIPKFTEPTRRLELLTARLQVGCATNCATPARLTCLPPPQILDAGIESSDQPDPEADDRGAESPKRTVRDARRAAATNLPAG